ncbi:MAG: hypothetical protein KA236_10565 [Verrucomicrobia bacterium]|jgi:hypothetical protein|nr:hypothetical protein [Verrucomicrobiota bacterium]
MKWRTLMVAAALSVAACGCGENEGSRNRTTSKAVPAPSPVGTWTAGDRHSVYQRLTIYASGKFISETVDFTGDVKGGFAGRWSQDGPALRFEWGSSLADHGSCSGNIYAPDSLTFGATRFHR